MPTPIPTLTDAERRVAARRHERLERHAYSCLGSYLDCLAEALQQGYSHSQALRFAERRHEKYVDWIMKNVGLD
jgi:hypothetical protein